MQNAPPALAQHWRGRPRGAGGSRARRPPAAVRAPDGVRWRVEDVTPGTTGGAPILWHAAPHPEATGRAFVARDGGRKLVRVVDRRPTEGWTAWSDVSEGVLRARLARAAAPPADWTARHARMGWPPRRWPA